MDGQLEPQEIEGNPIDCSIYWQAVGRMMYLSVGTLPDISFAVSRLAQSQADSCSLWPEELLAGSRRSTAALHSLHLKQNTWPWLPQ